MQIPIDKFLKKFLFLVIIFLPFQGLLQTIFSSIYQNFPLLNIINYLDEIAFFSSLLILITFVLISPSSYKIIHFPWDKYILLFVFIASLSLLINKVRLFQGIFGIYDVLKNIIVIYPFSLLCYSKEELLKIVKSIMILAFLLAMIGIIGEILAISLKFGIGYLVTDMRRLGFYRITSLVGDGNWNYFGIYLVLLFFLGVVTIEKWSKKVMYLISLLAAIFLTLSRQAWIGFGVIFMMRKKKLFVLGIVLFILISFTFLSNLSQYNPSIYYRTYALKESIIIFSQSPIIGVGPGMFGGLSSVLFRSFYYNEWPEHFQQMVYRVRNIDMFWPMMWAEFGILGTICYLLIGITLFLYLNNIIEFFRRNEEILLANIGSVLKYFIFALLIMGFTGGLNKAFVVFTYFAFVGIYISAYLKQKNEDLAS